MSWYAIGIDPGKTGALPAMELISPQRWRQVLDSSVPAKPGKNDLLAFALRRWPMMGDSLFRKKDHNRVEALIMAEYGRLKVSGQAK